MLLYSLLHLTGVKAFSKNDEALGEPSVPLEAIKKFRQLGSRCPGTPSIGGRAECAMTDEAWRECDDPPQMLAHLRGKASHRKLRLTLTGIARRAWEDLRDERSRRAIEIVECYADGGATHAELHVANRLVHQAREEAHSGAIVSARTLASLACHPGDGFDAARDTLAWVKNGRYEPGPPAVADVFREIFGNPFRPASPDPAWRTTDVRLLAEGIYAERAFDRMPILADALQDAGCDNDALLSHLRGANAAHVRGCWALDLVLGKE